MSQARKLAQVPPVGARRPYATHYYKRIGVAGQPERVGHAATRRGAVLAAVRKLSTVCDDGAFAEEATYQRVEIYDDFGMLCNTVERRKSVVAIRGWY